MTLHACHQIQVLVKEADGPGWGSIYPWEMERAGPPTDSFKTTWLHLLVGLIRSNLGEGCLALRSKNGSYYL